MRSFKTIFLILFFSCSKLFSVIILIHGTFSLKENWYQPNGKFFQELQKQATILNKKIVPFCWTGENNNTARIDAAKNLIQLILSYPETEEIILIGHSHGGNIINIASKLLHNLKTTALTCDSENIFSSQELANLINSSYERIYGQKLNLQTLVNIECLLNTKKEKSLNSKPTIKTNQKEFLIDQVYLLATPVNKENLPDMSIIKNLYNFYSNGDLIQKVFGFYKRKISLNTRVTNLEIKFTNNQSTLNAEQKPGHSELHDPIIAQWLLKIPDKLKIEKIGGFENFNPEQDGIIYLSENFIKYEKSKS